MSEILPEHWQAVAEKLSDYLERVCMTHVNCDDCQLSLECKSAIGWLEQAKRELGYE